MQHWLKVMHRFRGERQSAVGDPHRLGVDGEPTMCPAYEPGERAVIYVTGTYRCPAIVEFTGPPAFDAGQPRWGWRTPVRTLVEVPIDIAPWLEDIGVPRISVGRQSRLRLRPDQFAAAERALRARR